VRIRSDLVGVVYVESLVLRAGDTIPDGVTVGDHLFEPDGSEAPELEPKPPTSTRSRPRSRSPRRA